MAKRAPGALSRSRASGAQEGHCQDPAWSPFRLTRPADPQASRRGEAQHGSAHPSGGGGAALIDPGSGEEEERVAAPTSHWAGRVLVPASPPSPNALLGLGMVFPAAWKARVKKFAEYQFSFPTTLSSLGKLLHEVETGWSRAVHYIAVAGERGGLREAM